MAAHTDDNFHEIQLNGKQLVFVFMAATVVSVVIFLCGVLVGRGVRSERGAEADAAGLSAAAEPMPAPPSPNAAPAGSDPTAAAAPQAAEDLSYFDRLETTKPVPEQLKAAPPALLPVEKPAAAAPARTAPTPAAATGEPSGSGFAVQIAALNIRGEADAIAKRLSSKGYAAYVMAPPVGTPQIYRVRVGKFGSRRDAESIATKLEKEEQFKPWITR